MAKQESISPEELEKQRREKEKKEKEDRELKELEKKRKEKEDKRKRLEKRQKQREKQEKKRIKSIIDFPFKTLFQVSLLFTLLYFIIIFFGRQDVLYKAVFSSFMVFTALYLGLGIVLVAIFLVISEKRQKEFEEEIRIINEQKREEEEKKLQEMQDMEREIRETEKLKREEMRKARENAENIALEEMALNEYSTSDSDPLLNLPSEMGEHFEDLSYEDMDFEQEEIK